MNISTQKETYFNSSLLSQLRQSKRLSLRQLGTKVKISHSLLCNYETNRRVPTLRNLLRLEDFFDLERGSLLIKNNIVEIKSPEEQTEKHINDVCVEEEFALSPL